jgi:hypothetical protein
MSLQLGLPLIGRIDEHACSTPGNTVRIALSENHLHPKQKQELAPEKEITTTDARVITGIMVAMTLFIFTESLGFHVARSMIALGSIILNSVAEFRIVEPLSETSPNNLGDPEMNSNPKSAMARG